MRVKTAESIKDAIKNTSRSRYFLFGVFTYRGAVVSSGTGFFCPITVVSRAAAATDWVCRSAVALVLTLRLREIIEQVTRRILAVIVVTSETLFATLRDSFHARMNSNLVLTRIRLGRAHFGIKVAFFVCRSVYATLHEFVFRSNLTLAEKITK